MTREEARQIINSADKETLLAIAHALFDKLQETGEELHKIKIKLAYNDQSNVFKLLEYFR